MQDEGTPRECFLADLNCSNMNGPSNDWYVIYNMIELSAQDWIYSGFIYRQVSETKQI